MNILKILLVLILLKPITVNAKNAFERENVFIDTVITQQESYRLDSLFYEVANATYGCDWYVENEIYVSVYLQFKDVNWTEFAYKFMKIEGDSANLAELCEILPKDSVFREIINPIIEREKERFNSVGNNGFYVRFRKLTVPPC